ncbi:MAG: hypothetical protein HXS41_13640 [Theionarchaea archaeon]|nr:hypothetical protein [Theionarchaea archaeon]MBU7001225.1 hypothetical protein [Theionarchaea archaeon]MBU7022093.1 hypothetical protein [Theionarchaea archaeon]MBU7035656.1 hypothetical protein [Theionarchaea archaeon]MBU7040851.1 hypothetical protein [Theionarchaea archaeon]
MKPSKKLLVAAVLFAAASILQGYSAFLYNASFPREVLVIRLNILASGLFALAAVGFFIRSVKEKRNEPMQEVH